MGNALKMFISGLFRLAVGKLDLDLWPWPWIRPWPLTLTPDPSWATTNSIQRCMKIQVLARKPLKLRFSGLFCPAVGAFDLDLWPWLWIRPWPLTLTPDPSRETPNSNYQCLKIGVLGSETVQNALFWAYFATLSATMTLTFKLDFDVDHDL